MLASQRDLLRQKDARAEPSLIYKYKEAMCKGGLACKTVVKMREEKSIMTVIHFSMDYPSSDGRCSLTSGCVE